MCLERQGKVLKWRSLKLNFFYNFTHLKYLKFMLCKINLGKALMLLQKSFQQVNGNIHNPHLASEFLS